LNITVIGCGNAFSERSFNQSFVLEEDGRKMLVDCGYQVPTALRAGGFSYQEIDDFYISHLHADHIGGLEYIAFQRYNWTTKPRLADSKSPRIIGNRQLLQDLWQKSLRGGMESMEGFVAELGTFFHPVPIEPNESFEWQGWKIELVQQIHVMSGSIIMPSFGLLMSRDGHKTIYFVSDSQHCSPRQSEDFYRRADIIFQDAEFVGINTALPEGERYFEKDGQIRRKSEFEANDILELISTGWNEKTFERFRFGSGVHANYAQLAGYASANSVKLGPDIRAKMWLSHYQDFVLSGRDMYGSKIDWEAELAKDGFAGLLKVGMRFSI